MKETTTTQWILPLLIAFLTLSCNSDDDTGNLPKLRPQQIKVDAVISGASFTYDFSYNADNRIIGINMVRNEVVDTYRFNTSIVYNENDQVSTILIIDVDNGTAIQINFDYNPDGVIADMGLSVGGTNYNLVVENDRLNYRITSPDAISLLPLEFDFDENNQPTRIVNSNRVANISYGTESGVFNAVDVSPALNIWFQLLYPFSTDMYFFASSSVESYSFDNGETRTLINEQRDENGNVISFDVPVANETFKHVITYQPLN
ncbi:MAG: hypothetical protein ACFB0B_15990 [Thermonemataceae bacterium]